MTRLPHSYTNNTTLDGDIVVKAYSGPDAERRRAREAAALQAGYGRLPVPELLETDSQSLKMTFLPGTHGQDLIKAGLIKEVLRACGETLRRVHDIHPEGIFESPPERPGLVLVHGDYGPNNILLTPDASTVTGILDWEWAHAGDAIEDLAWCEWIIRMYHSEHLPALAEFFCAYGTKPTWEERHRAMIRQCRALVDFWERWQPGAEITAHRHRQLSTTETWTE